MSQPMTTGLQKAPHHQRFSVDAWNTHLGSVCGSFRTIASTDQVTGSVSMRSFLGVDIAYVDVSASHIVRGPQDVRSDGAEHYFLIGQKAAQSHIQHCGRSVLLRRGDLVLVDSSRQSEFIYTGSEQETISNQVSVHIPRTLLEGKFSAHELGGRIDASSDLAQCVWEQLTLFEEVAVLLNDPRLHTDKFRGHFLKAFTHMFYIDRHQNRFVQIMLYLLREVCEQDYGVGHFADMSTSSRRTFSRMFEQRDTSFGELLKYIRLLRFLKLCSSSVQAPKRPSVSSLIFQAGFNDVSNFNHMFKANFGISPGALIAKTA